MSKDISLVNIKSHISYPLPDCYKIIECHEDNVIAIHKTDRTTHTVGGDKCSISGEFTTKDSKEIETQYKKIDIHCISVTFS